MSKIKSLIEELHNEAEDEVYWLGSCEESQIEILENKLKLSLLAELKNLFY